MASLIRKAFRTRCKLPLNPPISTILVANTMEMYVQLSEIPHKQHSKFLFRLSVPWSFPLVVRQFTLLFRSIKGAAHGMNFGHMPVTVLRLCANPPPPKSMLSHEAVAEPQSSTGPSREWQYNIDLGGEGGAKRDRDWGPLICAYHHKTCKNC